MLPNMPGDARRTVQRFRRLFDVGLHGPDIFFYCSPLLKTVTDALGGKYHSQTGEEFFTRVCRSLRIAPSEAGIAYLYGVLCHYCLDVACHDYIREVADRGEVTHAQLETEFERRLLEMDGKVPACSQDLSRHIRLTPGECETVAKFYRPAGPKNISSSVAGMARYVKLFAMPEGPARRVLEKGTAILSKNYADMIMAPKPLPLCAPYLPELMERYEKAAELFPEMLTQLQAHMTYGAPFGEEFKGKFD
jgi:hypothetical protein